MKTSLLAWLILPLALMAQGRSFYAKVEPYETYEIKAATSGLVVSVQKSLEGKLVSQRETVIKLDDALEKSLLALDKKSLQTIRERAEALLAAAKIKEENFKDIQSLKTKSKFQKDTEEVNAISARISYLQALEQIYSLESQIAQRMDTIQKKSLEVHNRYVYKIRVSEGDYVNAGTALMDLMDISQAKVVFFVSEEEAKSLPSKVLYVDGKKGEAKIEKLYRVADSEHVSEYRVEAVLPSAKFFSKLVKIELKDE